MLKNNGYITLVTTWLLSLSCFGQGMWTWTQGDNFPNGTPVYGTMGVADPTNTPGNRYSSVSWTDLEGNFWLFAGAGSAYHYDDLWKYDPQTSMWTWIHGHAGVGQNAVYGTKGIPSTTNNPGRIAYHAARWTDQSNNLWMFGNNTINNVLWKYSISTDTWTWVRGVNANNQNGVYGTKGIADAANDPGGRYELKCSWIDDSGNLWLFGGNGRTATTQGYLNDLWKYDIALNQWTWINGDNTVNSPGVYGTLGIFDPLNKPGARERYSSWTDNDGYFWLFGGDGMDKNGNYGVLNDLWKYDPHPSSPTYNQWMWVNGSSTSAGSSGTYTQTCDYTTNNSPSGKLEASTWTDGCGNLWLFGGAGTNDQGDLWKYDISANKWIWVNGNANLQSPTYGTINVQATSNKPGSRVGAISWKNADGFWLYGGAASGGSNYYGDLWKYETNKPVVDFSFNLDDNCHVSFINNSSTDCDRIYSYHWTFDDPQSGTSNISNEENPLHQYSKYNTYTIKLVITNCVGTKDSISQTITSGLQLNVISDASIDYGEGTLLSAAVVNTVDAVDYEWSPVSGIDCATCQQILVNPSENSTYYVQATDPSGCKANDSVKVFVSQQSHVYIPNSFTPNGDGKNDVFIPIINNINDLHFKIIDRWGTLFFDSESMNSGWDGTLYGQSARMDVYICIVTTTDKQAKKQRYISHINLIR